MKKLHIVCPVCSKTKRIPIPYEIFEREQGALLKLPIRKGMICEHHFLALLDYHFSVRAYEIPKTKTEENIFSSIQRTTPKRLEFSF